VNDNEDIHDLMDVLRGECIDATDMAASDASSIFKRPLLSVCPAKLGYKLVK
jgi:hypothetical protein